MKVKLFGVKGVKTQPKHFREPEEGEEQYARLLNKLKEHNLTGPSVYASVRVMTGKNVGYWIPADMFSGDCLTYFHLDAIGCLHPDVLPKDISKAEIFEVEVDLGFDDLEEKV